MLCEFKTAKYLRDFQVVNWSQICSSCGYRWFEAFSLLGHVAKSFRGANWTYQCEKLGA